MTRIQSLFLVFVAAMSLGACGPAESTERPTSSPIALMTQEPIGPTGPAACMAALIEGILVADQATGVALRDPAGFVRPIIWPHGHTGRPGTPMIVVDANGNLVARVGDRVRIGGGEIEGNGPWLACGGITVVGPAAP